MRKIKVCIANTLAFRQDLGNLVNDLWLGKKDGGGVGCQIFRKYCLVQNCGKLARTKREHVN